MSQFVERVVEERANESEKLKRVFTNICIYIYIYTYIRQLYLLVENNGNVPYIIYVEINLKKLLIIVIDITAMVILHSAVQSFREDLLGIAIYIYIYIYIYECAFLTPVSSLYIYPLQHLLSWCLSLSKHFLLKLLITFSTKCENVNEFGDLLLQGEDLITEDDLRWPPGLQHNFSDTLIYRSAILNIQILLINRSIYVHEWKHFHTNCINRHPVCSRLVTPFKSSIFVILICYLFYCMHIEKLKKSIKVLLAKFCDRVEWPHSYLFFKILIFY
uniref:Transmembrane protein n=1 Tax=Heterorhabditis bacteriophora TaxID=37862 RepID=A0A1I7W970_HETBA